MPQAVVRHDDDVLDALEDEAIWAIREAISGFMRPVILYSIGKDSTVLIHLAAKAFAPAPIPVSTTLESEANVTGKIEATGFCC